MHRSQHQNITRPLRGVAGNKRYETRSVAASFGRHSMPQPVSNDTGTALGQDDSDWSRDLATLKVMASVADAGRRPPSVYQVEVRRPCHSEDMAHNVSALMWLVTLTIDLLTLKLVRESHQWLWTFIPNLDTLRLSGYSLCYMYATDGRTKAMLTAHTGGGFGHKKLQTGGKLS